MQTTSIDTEIAASLAAMRANADGPNLRAHFENGVRYLLARRLDVDQVPAAMDRVFDAVESEVLKDDSLSVGDLPQLIRKAIDSEAVPSQVVTRTVFDPRQLALTERLAQLKTKELRALRAYYCGEGAPDRVAPPVAGELRRAFFRKGVKRSRAVMEFGKTG